MAHALPLRNDFLREHRTVLGLSVALHVALVGVLALNLELMPRPEPKPARLAIEATVVDARAVRARAAEKERRVREAREAVERRRAEELERERLKQQEREAAAERERAEQRQEAERREAAQKREQQAERARATKARAERQQAEQEKAAAAAEAKRKAEAARREAQTRAELARQLAEEEDLNAAVDAGQLDQYAEIIRQKVERNWIRPGSARPGLECVVLVRQVPGGEVVDVRITECNGDAAVLRSIEAAVLRASPLPAPPDPALFDRSLRFEFRPRD
jgi:colicin import membrane protein